MLRLDQLKFDLIYWFGVLTGTITKEKDKEIPEGPYCYTPIKWEGNVLHTKVCPYYERKKGHAYCSRTRISGEDDIVFNDQVKCCGEKTDYEAE